MQSLIIPKLAWFFLIICTGSRYASLVYPRWFSQELCYSLFVQVNECRYYICLACYTISHQVSLLGWGNVYLNHISGNSVESWSKRSEKCNPTFFTLHVLEKPSLDFDLILVHIIFNPGCIVVAVHILTKKSYFLHSFLPSSATSFTIESTRCDRSLPSSKRNNAKKHILVQLLITGTKAIIESLEIQTGLISA